METESRHDANFIVIGGTLGYEINTFGIMTTSSFDVQFPDKSTVVFLC